MSVPSTPKEPTPAEIIDIAKKDGVKGLKEHHLLDDIEDRRKPIWSAISLAIINGDLDAVKILLQADISHNMMEAIKKTMLKQAIFTNQADILRYLIKEGVDIEEERTNLGMTPLLQALDNGSQEAAVALIEAKAEIMDTDKDGNTALHLAAKSGLTALFPLLLESIGMNTRNQNNETPIMTALKEKKVEAAKALLEIGEKLDDKVDVNVMDKYEQKTALHLAAKANLALIIPDLLKHGAKINQTGPNQITPLMLAARSGNVEAFNALISAKDNSGEQANVNAVDASGYTLLHYAVEGNSPEIIKKLLNMGLNINATNNFSRTPLMTLLLGSNGGPEYFESVAMLISANADVTIADNFGDTPLHVAAQYPRAPYIELVLKQAIEQKANIDARDSNNETPLAKAIESGNSQAVELLMNAGADIRAMQGPDNLNPLQIAELHDHYHLVPYLMERGANNEGFVQSYENYTGFLLAIYDFLKPCFNQNDLQQLAKCIELLFLKNSENDPLLSDRKALHEFVKENVNKIKDLYFQQHNKTLQNAASGLPINIDELKEHMTIILRNYIENFLLRKRNAATFWKPFVDAAVGELERPFKVEAPFMELPPELAAIALRLMPEHELQPQAQEPKAEPKEGPKAEPRQAQESKIEPEKVAVKKDKSDGTEDEDVVLPFAQQFQKILLGEKQEKPGEKPKSLDTQLYDLRLKYFVKNIIHSPTAPILGIEATKNPFAPAFREARKPKKPPNAPSAPTQAPPPKSPKASS